MDPRHLRHVFLETTISGSAPVIVTGQTRHHLTNVLRLRVGERIALRDVEGACFIATAQSIERQAITFAISGKADPPPAPPCHITVVQALGKGERFEQVLQHGTEIGVARFIPLVTQRTVPSVARGSAGMAHKMQRWQAVVRSAAEQSKRDNVPELMEPSSLPEALSVVGGAGDVLLLDADGPPILCVVSADEAPAGPATGRRSYALFVGPEGGFSDDEKQMALAAGARAVSASPYVLRTETAALTAASVLIARAMTMR